MKDNFKNVKWQAININDLSDTEYLKWYGLIAKEKQKRIDSLHYDKDKKLSIAGEMLARKLISEQLAITPEEIVFNKTKDGKPFAVGLNTHFNISHSGNISVCGINTYPIGIDTEKIREFKPNVAKRICSEEELKLILNSDNRDYEFTRIWTAKEAYAKYIGTGLSKLGFKDIPSDKAKLYRFQDYLISLCTEK